MKIAGTSFGGLLALSLGWFAAPSLALDRIRVDIESLDSAALQLQDLRLALTLESTRLVGMADWRTATLRAEEPLQLPALAIRFQLEHDGWQLETRPFEMSAGALQPWAHRWFQLPTDLTIGGKVDAAVRANGRYDTLTQAQGDLRLRELAFGNEAGDIAGENLSLEVSLAVQAHTEGQQLTLHAFAADGAALLGPVYLEFADRPLELAASGLLDGRHFELQTATLTQAGLLAAHGRARLRLDDLQVESATLTLERLQFPAAYSSLLQTALAGTVLGQLESRGEISALVEIRGHRVHAASIDLRALDFKDLTADRLRLGNLHGTLYWQPASEPVPQPSRLAWSGAGAYGLESGAASIALSWHGADISLLEAARLPLLDGALRIDHFRLTDPGRNEVRLELSAELEPIGMPALARAFDWPEFSGIVRGRIPRVSYADKVLRFDGDVSAEIFGGKLVGRDIRLTDPLGRWPRLSADLRFDDFDLEAVTRTFEIGTITGKLEGKIDGLELFAWSPVSFDALIRTPNNDRSRHRISVKAINSIANVGGNAGTGVATALQGGMLRFFASYGYKRLTFRCKLEDDICWMTGEGNEDDRYYLLEGRGLPRVDIVGYAGRVRWSQLVEQLREQIESGGSDLRIEY